jgi:hypothetical protein
MGFRQDTSVRQYAFESVTRPSLKFTVVADLNLVRKHNTGTWLTTLRSGHALRTTQN